MEAEEFMDKMHAGDPRCMIAVGKPVKKKVYDEGDYHPIGHPGRVTGSMYMDLKKEDEEKCVYRGEVCKEFYMVEFEGTGVEVLVLGPKIEEAV